MLMLIGDSMPSSTKCASLTADKANPRLIFSTYSHIPRLAIKTYCYSSPSCANHYSFRREDVAAKIFAVPILHSRAFLSECEVSSQKHRDPRKMGGVCASTKKRLVVVRQTSSLKFSLHQNSLDKKPGLKLQKKDSDLNLLPPELQKNWDIISDESVFEREKRMVVVLVGCQPEKPSQLVLVDVDFQSAGFGKVICRLSLPLPGEELYSLACMRNIHGGAHQDDLDHIIGQQQCQQFTLVAPVPSHSRIYVFTLLDTTMAETSSLSKANQQQIQQEGALVTQMRIQKCITREELSRWDLGAPLTVCSNSAGRSSVVPLIVVTTVDRGGHCKGDLLRLDRRTFCPVDRRKRSITEEDRESSWNSGYSSFSSNSPLNSIKNNTNSVPTSASTTTATIMSQNGKFPLFGGAVAINLRNGVVFSTEWGNLERIFQQKPSLKQNLGSQDILDGDSPKTTYGCSINVWEMRRRRLVQTIRLDPEDGLWPVAIRMMHHSELTHGFVCTALGSSIFHLHKSTKTGQFMADRVAKFCAVEIGAPSDWPGGTREVPAFLTDLAISMDDQHLFVCAAFHGFVAQMNISDPFRPTLTHKVFLGGIVYKCIGVTGLGKMPQGKSNQMSYNTEQVKVAGRLFEGGPCRLQLSLDGRRLFVTNSFLRNWDEHFFPLLAQQGSSIALIHVDPSGNKPMKIDTEFGVHFNAEMTGESNGPFYAREMRFLGGDSTADFI